MARNKMLFFAAAALLVLLPSPASVVDAARPAALLTGRVLREGSDDEFAGAVQTPAKMLPAYTFLMAETQLANATAECAEQVHEELPSVLSNALSFFTTYGFCALPTADEQYERLEYTLSYSLSKSVHSSFALEGPPFECTGGLRAQVADAIDLLRFHNEDGPLCIEADSDDGLPSLSIVG